MRVLLATTGTRGDVQPIFALAQTLARRGHEALVAAPPNFAAEAETLRLPFLPMGSDVQKLLATHIDAAGRSPVKIVKALKQVVGAEIDAQFGTLAAAGSFDFVVSGALCFAGGSFAEACGVPSFHISYCPLALPSSLHPPMLFGLARAPRLLNRALWWSSDRIFDWLLRGDINRHRLALGLSPAPSVRRACFSKVMLAADAELLSDLRGTQLLAPPAGALLLDDPRPLPEALQTFVAAGEAPIYIGFGSMPDKTPEATTQILGEAVQTLGCRAVVGSGWAGLGAGQGERVFVAGGVAHAALFPKMVAIIHHGGAGTVAAAARAGVPQIIVPHLADQFYWAERIGRLGLGPQTATRRRLTAPILAQAIGRCLQTPSYRERAREIARALAHRDGVGALATAIESHRC